MMRDDAITQYAAKWRRPIDNNFAVACYEQNSLAELAAASAAQGADATDMGTWAIDDPQEWHDAVAAALMARMAEDDNAEHP